MPDMLREDKVTSVIYLLTAIILLSITIIINIFYKPLIGFYLISLSLLLVGSSVIFPPKGKKITESCYVMRYHRDHFIVTSKERRIYITGERFGSDPVHVIYKEGAPKWLPPHESEAVSEKDYDYILEAVLKFLEKRGKQGKIKK